MTRRIDMVELEIRARRIAARKMGLVKDKMGERLPDDLWKQCLPDAVREAVNGVVEND